jgi:non-heme chloroperoxidase
MRPSLIAGFSLLLCSCAAESRTTWVDRSPHRVAMVTIAPDVTLEVLDWGGSGPPLVLLSGLQDVAHGFDEFAPQFADSFHVLAITRRGYGASSQTASGYDIATRVEDLRRVLDSLRLPRVVLAGHSIAGDELTAFAGSHPERLAGLIYLDAAFDHSTLGPVLAASPALPPMLAADSASPAAVQSYFRRSYGMTIPEAQLRAIGQYDADDHLRTNVTPAVVDSLMLAGCGQPRYELVRAPALVIDAVVDSAPQIFPSWASLTPEVQLQARRFTTVLQAWSAREGSVRERSLATAEVLRLHGANHYVFDSHRAEVTAAMRRFLRSLAERPRT